MVRKRGQVSIEYLMLISFVTFAIITALGLSYFYAGGIRESVKFNQIESFSNQLVSLAESVHYAGEPAVTTMQGYLPEGIEAIEIRDNLIIFNVTTDTGLNVLSYESNVMLKNGTISSGGGTKILRLAAKDENVEITEE